MICTIKWNTLTKGKWSALYGDIHQTSILQQHTYALSLSGHYGQKPSWGLIEIDGQEAGLVQTMQAGILGNILHAVIVDRGPLWLNGFGSTDHFKAFISEYNRQFPKRLGRSRRFIPEMPPSPEIDAIMAANKFIKKDTPGYQTIWLDLTQDGETLRANLHGSWRRSLRKAEASNLTIEWDTNGMSLPWVLKYYQLDKKKRGYEGPDLPIITALSNSFAAEGKLLVGMAMLDNKPVAAILVLMHGRSATYQIGWSTEDGRKYCAHHVLLWRVLNELKTKDIKDFDLGGVNDDSAKSLKRFKSGMGGTLSELAGLYT